MIKMHNISYVPNYLKYNIFTDIVGQNARRQTRSRSRKSIRRKLGHCLTSFLEKMIGCLSPLCFRGLRMVHRNNDISDCKSRRSYAYM